MNETLSNFTGSMLTQMNDPGCSILAGMTLGEIFIVKWLLGIVCCYLILKLLDRLAFEPFIVWCKKKLYKKE